MKKGILVLFFAIMVAGPLAMANGKNNKAHLALKGKNDVKINCVYCHTTAKVEKKKGQDHSFIDKHEYCTGKGCHPVTKGKAK